MRKKSIIYYETVDGSKFFEIDEFGEHDSKAQSKAAIHEQKLLNNVIGDHEYYIIEIYTDESLQTLKGYVPKINKPSGFTTNIKFAKRYNSVHDAYKYLNEQRKIIGINQL